MEHQMALSIFLNTFLTRAVAQLFGLLPKQLIYICLELGGRWGRWGWWWCKGGYDLPQTPTSTSALNASYVTVPFNNMQMLKDDTQPMVTLMSINVAEVSENE